MIIFVIEISLETMLQESKDTNSEKIHLIVALFAWLSTYWGSQYTGSQPCISKDALLTTVSTCMILALDKKVLEFLQRIKIWENSISMPGWKKHEISAVELEMPPKFW